VTTPQIITDFITGKSVPSVGAEANRQEVEKILVEKKGFSKSDIEVDVDIDLVIAGSPYHSQIDLVVSVAEKRVIVIKCAAGSLGSREREVVSAARLLDVYQIPFALVSDGNTAILLDTISGKILKKGIEAIPSKEEVLKNLQEIEFLPVSEKKIEREKLVFRTYDMENINVQRSAG
jgi:hypothetical protein